MSNVKRRCKKCGAFLSSYNDSEYCHPCGIGEIEVSDFIKYLIEAVPENLNDIARIYLKELLSETKDPVKLERLISVYDKNYNREARNLPIFGHRKTEA